MSKDIPVPKLGRSRSIIARTLILIRTFSWVLIMVLRTDSQYLAAHCMGLQILFLVSTNQGRQVHIYAVLRRFVSHSYSTVEYSTVQYSTVHIFNFLCFQHVVLSSFLHFSFSFPFSFYSSLLSPLYYLSLPFRL